MINRSTLALSIAIAALFPASMAFAQTREMFGPVLPMIYDGQGGRHYCLYGYDGPFDPPMESPRRRQDHCLSKRILAYAEVSGQTVHLDWRPIPGGGAEMNCHRQRGQPPHCK